MIIVKTMKIKYKLLINLKIKIINLMTTNNKIIVITIISKINLLNNSKVKNFKIKDVKT